MSLIGYRNLQWLKDRLLPADMNMDADHEADLTAIGEAVAAQFDAYTGRTLRRTVGATHETSADQPMVVVPCYPIETATAKLITGAASTETDISTSISGIHKAAGIVRFFSSPGSEEDLVRLTITGGYWCDDNDTQPSGSTAIPADILGAWVQQCRAVCEAENTFRSKGAGSADKKTSTAISLDKLTLLPGVKTILQLYIRYA